MQVCQMFSYLLSLCACENSIILPIESSSQNIPPHQIRYHNNDNPSHHIRCLSITVAKNTTTVVRINHSNAFASEEHPDSMHQTFQMHR